MNYMVHLMENEEDIKIKFEGEKVTVTGIAVRKFTLKDFVIEFESMLLEIREAEDEIKNVRRRLEARERDVANLRKTANSYREYYRIAKERCRDNPISKCT